MHPPWRFLLTNTAAKRGGADTQAHLLCDLQDKSGESFAGSRWTDGRLLTVIRPSLQSQEELHACSYEADTKPRPDSWHRGKHGFRGDLNGHVQQPKLSDKNRNVIYSLHDISISTRHKWIIRGAKNVRVQRSVYRSDTNTFKRPWELSKHLISEGLFRSLNLSKWIPWSFLESATYYTEKGVTVLGQLLGVVLWFFDVWFS